MTDEHIDMNKPFQFEGSFVFDMNPEGYARALGMAAASFSMAVEYNNPLYSGPRPRFALWGARAGYVQVGGREDSWWQRRLAKRRIMKLTFPIVKTDSGIGQWISWSKGNSI